MPETPSPAPIAARLIGGGRRTGRGCRVLLRLLVSHTSADLLDGTIYCPFRQVHSLCSGRLPELGLAPLLRFALAGARACGVSSAAAQPQGGEQ